MTVQNLDSLINTISHDMVEAMKNVKKTKTLINNIDKALGVLVNDGVYAYYVYFKSRSDQTKKIYVKDIVDKLEDVIVLDTISCHSGDKYDNFFLALSNDLQKLLFFKDILERVLIYARYHGKAIGGGE